MSRVKPLDRSKLSEELEQVLAGTESRMGFLPNSQLIMAYKPKLLQAFGQLANAVNGPDVRTPRALRALVGHMASRSAGCQYCVAHTGDGAHHANIEDQKLAAIWQYETSPLFSEAERAALRLAQCAASVPNAVSDADFVELRKHFSDEEIVELVAVIAFFGFLNRWNDTLATELEPVPLAFASKTLAGTGWEAGKHAPGRAKAAAE
jgi:uncharacterized peroxidase-related enzyme